MNKSNNNNKACSITSFFSCYVSSGDVFLFFNIYECHDCLVMVCSFVAFSSFEFSVVVFFPKVTTIQGKIAQSTQLFNHNNVTIKSKCKLSSKRGKFGHEY